MQSKLKNSYVDILFLINIWIKLAESIIYESVYKLFNDFSAFYFI